MPDPIVLDFEKFAETKGTWRYQEVLDEESGADLVVGALYVKKSAVIRMGKPERLKVAIKPQ